MEHLQRLSKSSNEMQKFYRVPLTTFFKSGRNSVGVTMQANSGSGQECTGLNDGSKNSVATTYLADAWDWGAEIFCGCDVQYVEQGIDGKGYVIYLARHGSGREEFGEEFKHQLFWVKAVCLCGNEILSPADWYVLHSRKSSASLEQALWALQRSCFVRGSMLCECLRWWE